jgi:hypothetical protein
MQLNQLMYGLPKEIKLFLAMFILVLSIGFYTGLLFVEETSSLSSTGIQQNYLGNEDDAAAVEMKFKKSEREMLSIVHSHILSMSMIFFLLGVVLAITDISKPLKMFLMIEPFFSVLATFGGIYFLWKGVFWMKYLVMFSGALMTLTFTLSVGIILIKLARSQK